MFILHFLFQVGKNCRTSGAVYHFNLNICTHIEKTTDMHYKHMH